MNKKIYTISVLIIILDQVSKVLITSLLNVGESIKVISDFLSITYIQNHGIAFGMFQGRNYFIIIGTVISGLIIYKFMYTFKMNFRNIMAFGLVIGGLFGNLIDRVMIGYVRDFIDVIIFGYDYPIFNISDCAIVIGVLMLIYAILKGEDKVEVSS